jgi:hypothetical protein
LFRRSQPIQGKSEAPSSAAIDSQSWLTALRATLLAPIFVSMKANQPSYIKVAIIGGKDSQSWLPALRFHVKEWTSS